MFCRDSYPEEHQQNLYLLYRELLKWDKMGQSSSRGTGVKCARGVACGAVQCEFGFGPQSLPPLRRALLAWWGLLFKTNNPKVWASH